MINTSETLRPSTPPERVRWASNIQEWSEVSFLHWQLEPKAVQALLPPQLAVDTWDGAAWVGMTPFLMKVRGPSLPKPVFVFPSMNVRTYVLDPDGRPGLYFFHMEVGRTWFMSLRLLGLPYVRREMCIEDPVHRRVYLSRPYGRSGPAHRIEVVPGEPASLDHPLARFLVARWRAFHLVGPVVLTTAVEHPPWALHSAQGSIDGAEPLWDRLGIRPRSLRPVAHYSPGVIARLGWPRAKLPMG